MNKTLLTVFKVILHVVAWPLLFALIFIINRNVIAGGSMYGLSVFVCFIVAAVGALIFYLTYFLVRTRKKRSIINQHIIIAIVAVLSLGGFWMLLDAFIPAPLETATSSTLRWEDLSDNWAARAEVQEQLLSDYVTINYNLGRLTAPNGETLEDYIKAGPNGNEELHALLEADFHSIDSDGYASFKGPAIDYAQADRMTIPVLLHLFLDDRSAVQGANSDYAKANNLPELTIAVPYYTAYTIGVGDDPDEVSYEDVRIYHGYKANDISGNSEATFFVTDQDLNVQYDTDKVAVISRMRGKWMLVTKVIKYGEETVEEATAYDTKGAALTALYAHEEGFESYFIGGYKQASVGWHVLDMMGTAMDMQVLSASMMDTDLVAVIDSLPLDGALAGVKDGIKDALNNFHIRFVSDVFQLDLVPDALAQVADLTAEDELLGSPIYISVDSSTGTLYLTPSNSQRGTLGYMEMAWLENQGLLYIIVSLFSTRTLFYIYAPFMGIIAILLGVIREQERKLKEAGVPMGKPKKEKKGKKDDKPTEATASEAPAISADDLLEDEPQEKAGSDILDFDV